MFFCFRLTLNSLVAFQDVRLSDSAAWKQSNERISGSGCAREGGVQQVGQFPLGS